METRLIRLCDAANAGMMSGDLLLYRASSPLGLLISRAGRTRYCHAGRAFRGIREWRTLDTTAWHGGRNISLAGEVLKHSGRIDVFEPNRGNYEDHDPELAVKWLQEHVVDRRFGWWSIARTAEQPRQWGQA